MATYEDILPEIKLRAYGVSDPVVELYVRATAIDFCERTRLWKRLVQEYAFKGDGRIVLSSVDEFQESLEAVLPGTYNGVKVIPTPIVGQTQNLNSFAGLTFANDQQGPPQFIFEVPDEENTVGVWPIPDKQYSDVTFMIALKPLTTATVIPDFLIRDYREAMIEGTLSRIHNVDGQSFTNPQKAGAELINYKRLLLDGRVASTRGRLVSGDLAVQMRPLATGRR